MKRITALLVMLTAFLGGGATAAQETQTKLHAFAPCVSRQSPVPLLTPADFSELKGISAIYRISITKKQLELTSGKPVEKLAFILPALQQVMHLPCNVRLSTLVLYRDPTDRYSMQVWQEHRDNDIAEWTLAINLHRLNVEPGFKPRLIHEVGHLLFDYADEIDKNGCLKRKAEGEWGNFIWDFQKKFWDCTRSKLPTTKDRDFWHRFHLQHSARSVTEDVPNTFAIFVLCGKPQQRWQTTAWQKIHHYWQYPEVVAVRAKIRQSIGRTLQLGAIHYRGRDLCIPRSMQ